MTKIQEELLAQAMGDGMSWPALTSDPRVNFEIDKLLDCAEGEWESLDDKTKVAYIEEANSVVRV